MKTPISKYFSIGNNDIIKTDWYVNYELHVE